jgi:uncharacterized protein (TIGR02145 family)
LSPGKTIINCIIIFTLPKKIIPDILFRYQEKRNTMKNLMFLLIFFSALRLNAQNYQITFSGTGASTSVSSVKVENLTTGTSLTLSGSDILRLTIATLTNSPKDNQTSDIKIYPNPMTDFTTLEIFPPVEGDAVISINDLTGKSVYKNEANLKNLMQSYKITGLKTGVYLVSIKGNGFQITGKLVSNGNSNSQVNVGEINTIAQSDNIKKSEKGSKGSLAYVDMSYTDGDRLKFTGSSGNYKTIVTDIPASDKTIIFNFVACEDADYNIYPVVQIGSQVWMVENLKTTKYNDGTAIANVTDNTTWSALTTAAYCDYQNTPVYSNTYGRLYNWYVVSPSNPKKVCPTGWHVPTDAQWTDLSTFLGGTSIAGGKLKETTTTHWLNPNAGASNETGFTALPGGYRDIAGTFGLLGSYGFWWSYTISGTTYALYRYLYYNNGNMGAGDDDQKSGFYIRCLHD